MAPVLLKLKEKEMRPTFFFGREALKLGLIKRIGDGYMGGSVDSFKFQQETACEITRG